MTDLHQTHAIRELPYLVDRRHRWTDRRAWSPHKRQTTDNGENRINK